MKTVILCGGQGTRIRDVNDTLPKPMIPVGEFPILWHIMRGYAQHGHKDFVLCLGYKARIIKEFFLNYEALTRDFTLTFGSDKAVQYHGAETELDWSVTLADTGLNTLTGGRIAKIAKYVEGETFMLTYGDGLSDVDIGQLLAFHQSHDSAVTVTGVRPPGRFGEMESGDGGKVTEFNEKPQASGGRISGGFFVCDAKVFDYLEDREDLTFEETPLRKLAADGELRMFDHDGYWQCMDTYRDYKLLNDLWAKGKSPWLSRARPEAGA
ncbi:MAG: glucose-1-phosphate cytidylyltransferase [Magnetovibrionaceae bacterium]